MRVQVADRKRFKFSKKITRWVSNCQTLNHLNLNYFVFQFGITRNFAIEDLKLGVKYSAFTYVRGLRTSLSSQLARINIIGTRVRLPRGVKNKPSDI